MEFNYIKNNPSKFLIPPRGSCPITNVYDIPVITPINKSVEECSKTIEKFQNKNNNTNLILKNKKYLWTFVDENIPHYIELNIESFIKYYGKEYDIIVLNKNNIYTYLPDFKLSMNNFDKVELNKRIEILKYSLLFNYGGLWIDSSTLIYNYFNFKNYSNYDLVLFKNPNQQYCNNSNQIEFLNTKIIKCKSGLNIMKDLLDYSIKKLINSFNNQYNNINEKLLYDIVKLYNSVDDCNRKYSNTKIMILSSNYLGKISDNNRILTIKDYLQHYKFNLDSNSFCTFIDNNENYYKSPFELFYYNRWFLNSKQNLLNSAMFISYLYRLNI